MRTFVEFSPDNAAQVVRAARYIPLPQRAYELVQQRVDNRKTGSIFDRSVPVGVSIEELLAPEGQ